MKAVKNILRTIWGVYCATVFIIPMIVLFPFLFIVFGLFGEKATRPVIWFCYRVMGNVYPILFLMRLKTYGREKFPKDEPCIIVSNHQSQMDIIWNAVGSPVLFKFLGKREAIKIPFLGTLIRFTQVLVDRKSKESRAASFDEMKRQMDKDWPIAIYAEGTRNRTDYLLKDFYDGAFRLAIQTGRPIMVQTLVNSWYTSNPHRTIDAAPGRVLAFYDGPIYPEGKGIEDVARLREQVRACMLKHLMEHERPPEKGGLYKIEAV